MFHFDNQAHGWEIAGAIPRIYNPMADRVISRTDSKGRLLGGVIYESMISNCIFMHQAGFSKMWMSQDALWLFFDYPFNQLKVGKVCGTVPSSKPALIRFNEKIGFREECRIKDAYKDGDLVIMSMRREDCRWLHINPRAMRSNQ